MGWTKSEFIVAIKKKLVIWGYYDIVLELTSDFYTFFLLIYSGEGNGNPLQYSCLENPMDGGAW